jgi:uncharacterized membrane protein
MPMTGFTAIVRRSETIDLKITIDQALQYIVSCGVVCPPQLLPAGTPRRLEDSDREEVGATIGEKQ